METVPSSVPVIQLGRLPYAAAYEVQCAHVDQVIAGRESGRAELGRILVVEHDPVITVSRRPGAREHLTAPAERLAELGVTVAETDRGGDITYHGPGQLVVYPILDLNRLNLGVHAYMRLLEQSVIDVCRAWGLDADREAGATGVWIQRDGRSAKIAAMGVRVRRWVSMHGLSFNIAPDLSHFGLIVPCGLAGRSVTSLSEEARALGRVAPSWEETTAALVARLVGAVGDAAETADRAREGYEHPAA